MNFKKTTLPNGLRIITVPVKDNPAVMVLVVVETGSNYESKSENGLSHFLEHMCFKGTANRPKVANIARELDGLGAQNNAFTSNELTGYYAKAAKKHFSKLFEIVADLYLNPILPAEDLEKERGVILEEISMYEDLPQKKVWYVLAELMYGDTPAGRSTLGSRGNIKTFKRQNFIDYRNKHYVASKTIVIVAGDINERVVLREVKRNFAGISTDRKIPKFKVNEKQIQPGLLIYPKKTDQTHLIMAFRTYGAKDKRIPVLILLADILGQGMSSRLFNKLRDEMGACYYIRAEHDAGTDHGVFAISAGINISRVREVTEVLLEECGKLSKVPVSNEELQKAKEHYVGHLYLDLETTDSVAEFYAHQEITAGKLRSPQELEATVRQVTAKDIVKVAGEIFKNDRLNLAIVGDVIDRGAIKKVLSFK
jgi:predicted Zn-dependent peptidase